MTRLLFLLLAVLIIQWPALAFAATTVETSIPWPLLAVVILLAAAVGFLWIKLRGAERDLAVAHEIIAKHDSGKQDLLDHEQQLRAVIDAIPFPVWWRRQDLTLIGCNSAYCETLESDYETVLGESLELGASAIDDEGRGLAARALQMGIGLSESHHIVHEGSRLLLEFTEAPLAETNGGVGHAVDVSALEHVQSELSSHISAHAEVLESLATAIAIFGPDRRLKFFNVAFIQLWGIEPDNLRNEPLIGEMLELLRERRVLPEYVDFPAFKQEQDRLFVSVLERQEELMHLPDGRTLRRAVSPHPFGGLLFFFEDVTDRLALEHSYNTLIEVQRETINNLHEGVAVFAQDGRLRLWNPTLLEMWKLEREFLEAEPHVSDIIDATREFFLDADDWQDRKRRLVLQITEGPARNGRLDRLDESVLDFACVPLPDGGCLVSYVDVTDTVRVQRALEERNIALEMADQVKTEFIANVSYELRTPLNTISGFTDVLDGELFGTLNPRQREYVSGIVTASRQLTELIDYILDLATIEAGYMALDLQSIRIEQILVNVRDRAKEKIESGRLTLEIDCPPDVGTARLDETRMTKALFNLLWNSIMFQSDEDAIVLQARRRGDQIAIEIVDSVGIVTSSELANVYETFEHGDPYVRRTGSSLGLALTRSLVELHNGSLEIRNDAERGTRAVAYFPIAGPTPIATKARVKE